MGELRQTVAALCLGWVSDFISRVEIAQDVQDDEAEGPATALREATMIVQDAAAKLQRTLSLELSRCCVASLAEMLVSSTVQAIVSIPDIAAKEIPFLQEMISCVLEVETCVAWDPQGAKVPVNRLVPSLSKASMLVEVLDMSLSDIQSMFADAGLNDFHPDELSSLVKSLFQDSAKKTKTLRLLEEHSSPSW